MTTFHWWNVFLLQDIYQGYSIILRKGPFTNAKNFRGPVTPIKSCKCDMSWTKNMTCEYNTIAYLYDI